MDIDDKIIDIEDLDEFALLESGLDIVSATSINTQINLINKKNHANKTPELSHNFSPQLATQTY